MLMWYILEIRITNYLLINTNVIITPTKVCTLYTKCKLKFLTALLKISSFFGKRNISHKWHFTFTLDTL